MLDVDMESLMPTGRTLYITVPRSHGAQSLVLSAVEEILALLRNGEFDARIPLEVDFYEEGGILTHSICCNAFIIMVIFCFTPSRF